ncbi:MAG: hypothetical protein KDA32_01295 [Phycisphaerales bacterium]|nr:hypothetical protein [Phycisphaerales bacterium]
MKQTAIGFLVCLVAFSGLAYYKSQSEKATDRRIGATIALVQGQVRELPSFEAKRAFFERYLDLAHDTAYSTAYTPGTRQIPASFDSGKYARVYCDFLRRHARTAGEKKLEQEFRDLEVRLEEALPSD